jgi:hypothetical protein
MGMMDQFLAVLTGELHAPASLSPGYSSDEKLDGPHGGSGRDRAHNNLLPLPGTDPTILQLSSPYPKHYIDKAIHY